MNTGTLNAAHAQRAGTTVRTGGDRCPTITSTHRASDGQILRLRLPGGRLRPRAASAIAEVAAPGERIELTSRANLQLRGLDADRTAALQQVIAAHHLAPSADHERARTILASPLVGRLSDGPIDDAIVDAVDAAICARLDTTALSGRVLTVIDDGTGHGLAGDADLLLRWNEAEAGVELWLGGRLIRTVEVADAATSGAKLLGALATTATRHGAWRARELPPAALASFGGAPAPAVPAAPPLPIGVVAGVGGRAAARAIAPLGRLTPEQLAGAAALGARADTDVRIDHDRGVTLVDLPAATAHETLRALANLGLIAEATDPAIGLTGCAGRDCARTDVDVRGALALRRATRRPGAPREHLVGCERRCGAPRDGHTIVASPTDTAAQLAARAATAPTTSTAEARPC